MEQPLAGIRVIDLTRILSGPFCTMLLADMGADVLKVETPGKGDPVCDQGAKIQDLSWYFAAYNRNKRSIAIDLRQAEGKALLERLIAGAQVLVENFRPGVLAEMGFDDAKLAELNPKLVVASVNGYGSTGPYVDRPSFDFIAQAMSGFMSATGEPGGPPMRAAPPITDFIAGLYCAYGIVNALRAAERSGKGQKVEASMVNGMLSMLAYLASEYFATGKVPDRTGNDHPIASPYGLFRARDGDIAIAPATMDILKKFLVEIGLDGILEDPRFATPQARRDNRPALNALINDKLSSDSLDSWIERLNRAGVPAGKVMSVAEVFDDAQVKAQDMTIDVPHPGHGTVRMVGFPVKMSATPCRVVRPAPRVGEHTTDVLAEHGLDAAEIERLRRAKVIA